MDDYLSTFDRGRLDLPYIRRRDLLSPALKIYIWCGMLSSEFIIIKLIVFLFTLKTTSQDWRADMFAIAFLIFNACLFFGMNFLLWMQVAWAITFNWIVAGTWLTMGLAMAVLFKSISVFYLLLPFLMILLPYFILIFRIRKKWTHLYTYDGKALDRYIKKHHLPY